MNFFKKLFSFGNKNDESEQQRAFDGVFTDTYFNNRYIEQNLNDNPVMLDGCLKMIEGFFLDNKIERKVEKPVNHPVNLDQTIDEGLGFLMYCRAFKLGDKEALLFLAYAFSDFLINNYGFKLYKDKEPEHQLRFMTLKYNKRGAVLSLYPFEYAAKVLNYEARFEDLYNRIDSQFGNLPTADEFLKDFINPKE